MVCPPSSAHDGLGCVPVVVIEDAGLCVCGEGWGDGDGKVYYRFWWVSVNAHGGSGGDSLELSWAS